MVLEGVAEIVLSKLLDKVFYGINKQNIQVALLDGKFLLSNIGLQPSLLAELNLPLQLKYSYVEKVQILLPWREEEVSLTINISNIYLLVTTGENSFINLYEIFMKRKQRVVQQAIKEFKANLQKRENKKQYGYIQKILLNLLDNVNIKIECIHLRCENKIKKYSFGIKINEVSARTVNQQDKPFFFNREKNKEQYIRYIVQMDFMGIYFNSKEEFYLAGLSLAQITDQFSRLSHKRFRNYSENFDSEEASDNFNYILTISLRTIVKKYINALEQLSDNKEEKYLFQCVINLSKVESKITDQQYYDLLQVIGFISDFQKNYVQFVNRYQLINPRDRKAKDISDLLRKKKTIVVGKREKETLKKNCRKYIGWIFRSTYEQILKQSFVRQAVRKQVNFKHLKQNRKTLAIMSKIDNQKLKFWILISLYTRKMYQQKVSIFLRGSSDKQQSFARKNINNIPIFQPFPAEQQINKQRQASDSRFQIFLKLVVNIQEFNFEISRQNNLGVYFNLQKLKAQLILRQRNYIVKIFIEDLEADVFHCKKTQKLKTNVPIIKRNCILDNSVNLFQITFERNPVGKPFIFTDIEARLQSIEITIYPQAFKQFYSILLGNIDQPQKKKKKADKKQEVADKEDRTAIRQIGFQKTIIRAKIKTPWIVLPFSPINNPGQECWVARLGDFYIKTPQHEFSQAKTQEQIFYEQYKLELKRFELSYFSSISYFHNWLKLNYQIDNLRKIRAFDGQKIITMIEPFSCDMDLSLLKSSLSLANRQRRPKIKGTIKIIDEVKIRISKFLMVRLKSKVDNVLNEGQLQEFIQSNVANIKQENELNGYCRVSYQGIKKLKLYCILKGIYMYFFLNENHPKYHFFVNINKTAIRLISNEVQNFNNDQTKLICFYLDDRIRHQLWRKKILHVLNKKYKKMETTQTSKIPLSQDLIKQSKDSLVEEKNQDNQVSSSLKLALAFLMNKLSIQLFDQKDKLFLDCNFKKATLEYCNIPDKSLKCSLNQWTVCEGQGSLFMGSNMFFGEEEGMQDPSSLNNFLQVCCGFNSITEQLRQIQIKVDKLFLAWKVQLFTRILLFFFYDEEAADAPTPINFNKRQLQIKISIQRFTFYCYFITQLIALTKLQTINIRYFQNDIEEIYDVNCKVFQMDKYINSQIRELAPMIRRKNLPDNSRSSEQPIYNNFALTYILRKKDTESFPNIRRLKQRFGENVLVSQIVCSWQDTQIFFENELTLRLLNYYLNKVLGTVASKFKKRDYSPNYIFQSLKLCKLSVFNIQFSNCSFRIPPHQRGYRQFSIDVKKLKITKNIDEGFMPNQIQIPTIRTPLKFFWQSMVIKILDAELFYHVGREPPIQILNTPLNLGLVYSKMNFQREYFVILQHHDDVDRRATMDLVIEEQILINLHKIMFVTFLQIFYQNIKQKDGRADVFEPPLPFPSLREYNIYIQKINLNMQHFKEKDKLMESFASFFVGRFKLAYKQVGQQTNIRLEGQTLQAQGELPIYSLDPKRKKFLLEMSSKEGQMKVVINVGYYAIEADLDKLNNIIEFINYDNDYVSNKLMQKRSSSWQYVNVFAKNCELRLGDLRVEGEFYISYLKGMKNDPELAAKQYLLTEQIYNEVKKDAQKLNWDDLTDKQIKVNGEQLRLSIGADNIGEANSFCFNRYDLSCKSTNRRFKKQRVQVGQAILHIQLPDLLTLWKTYNDHIKKKSNFQLNNFYQPWDMLPTKAKVIEKRATQVSIQRISINIMPANEIDFLRYLRIELKFPAITYKTYRDQQQVTVNIVFSLWHHKEFMSEIQVGQCKSLRICYLNFKERHQKSIEIVHGKGIVINFTDISNRTIYSLIEQGKKLSKVQRINLHIDNAGSSVKYLIKLKNEGTKRVKLNLSGHIILSAFSAQQQSIFIDLEAFLQIMSNPKSYIQVHEEGSQIIRKTANQLSLNIPNLISTSFCLLFKPTSKCCNFTFRPIYTLFNFTTSTIILKDKRILKPGENVSFIPIKYEIQFQVKYEEWIKKCTISTKKQEQLFADDCFVSSIKQQQNTLVVNLSDRFTIKNLTWSSIFIRNHEILPFQQYNLGYVPKSLRSLFPAQIQKQTISIDLLDSSNISYSTRLKGNPKSQNADSFIKFNLKSQLKSSKKLHKIIVYAQFIIRNLTFECIQFRFNGKQALIDPNENLMLPLEYLKAQYRENKEWFEVKINKQKQYFSDNLKFMLHHKFDKKATFLKIQSKFSIRNLTDEVIDFQISKDKFQSIESGQNYQVPRNSIKQSAFILIFGKSYRKQFLMQKVGSNYLQIQDIIYKITLLLKQQCLLIIQKGNIGHNIINKLSDISIIAYCYDQHKENKNYSFVQINNDTNIEKLIKPDSTVNLGLFAWNNPQIQLQFYLDSKNLQFKQKFKFNFQKKNYKFAYKISLHDEKDKKNACLLVITVQRDSQSRYTFTAYKQKDYQKLPVEKLKVSIQEISLTIGLSNNPSDSLTFECSKATLLREKSIGISEFDVQIEKLLIRQGKNISILNALSNSRFLNSNLILSKSAHGISINNMIVKLTPFELIFRQKFLFKILEKIVAIRQEALKKSKQKQLFEQTLIFHKSKSIQPGFLEIMPLSQKKLQKSWENIKKKYESKVLVIDNMQISETSLYLTYMKEQYKMLDQKIASDAILKYMLLMPSISQLKLSVPHLKISQFEGEYKQFGKQIISRLKQSIGGTIANSFSALPIFDNPIILLDGLFKYIEGMLSIQ